MDALLEGNRVEKFFRQKAEGEYLGKYDAEQKIRLLEAKNVSDCQENTNNNTKPS